MEKMLIGFDRGANSWQVINDGRFCPPEMGNTFESIGCQRDKTYSIHNNGRVYLCPDGVAGQESSLIGSLS